MELVLGFGWLFGSLYALVSLFRPLPPLKRRKQAVLVLIGVQIAAVAAAIAMPSAAPVPVLAGEVKAAAAPSPVPDAKSEASSSDPSYLVRTKPGQLLKTLPAASASDIATLKTKTRAGLKTLDAAEVVLMEAVRTSRIDLVRDAGNAASKVAFAMTSDREPLIGTAELEKVLPCEGAAYTLARLASSIVSAGQSVAAVQDRVRLQAKYGAEREACEVWAGR